MKVIIIGGGKVGFYLCKTLLEHGHQPTLIEQKKTACESLANQLDLPVIHGDGSSVEALELAGAACADALICVTGRDQDNLVACQLAKDVFSIPKTISRINNPKNSTIMKKLGIDIPISSTENIVRLLEREIDTAQIKQLLPLNRGEASINEVQLPQNYRYDGCTLLDLPLPEECVIVSILRQGQFLIPRGSTQLKSGDTVLVVAQNRVLHQLLELLQVH